MDNSLSAQASKIEIRFSPFDEPYVAILDNGTGMLPEPLTAAMRHGSQNPTIKRGDEDLGRFGLVVFCLSGCFSKTQAVV